MPKSLNYQIVHKPDMAILKVILEYGQSLYAEPATMACMDSCIRLTTGIKGGIFRSFAQCFSGKKLFINTFYAPRVSGEVYLAPGPWGDIGHCELQRHNILLMRGAFMAHSEGVFLKPAWEGIRGAVHGAGPVLLKACGQGDLFFNSYGAIMKHNMSQNDQFVVDTASIVAFHESLDYRITPLAGITPSQTLKTFLLGNEGLVCHFQGEGTIWFQTRNALPLLKWAKRHQYRRNSSVQ